MVASKRSRANDQAIGTIRTTLSPVMKFGS